MADIDEKLVRQIVREVLAQTHIDKPINFQKASTQANNISSSENASGNVHAVPENNVDWFQPLGQAKPGYSKDEIVIAVAPAFATVLTKTESGISHQEALRQVVAGIDLQTALIERGAFDAQTNLRTRVAYQEDAQVFIETNRRFQLPVSTLIIKIRYYNDLRRMMTAEQLTELLQLASSTIKKITRDNDITYLLDRDDRSTSTSPWLI